MTTGLVIGGVILIIFIVIVVDLIIRNNRSFKKFEELYLKTQGVLEKIQADQALEKEKSKIVEGRSEVPVVAEEVQELAQDILPGYSGLDEIEEEITTPEEFSTKGIYNTKHVVDYNDVYLLPCLDKEELPIHVRVTEKIADCIRREFSLPSDNSQLLQYDDIQRFMKENGIQVVVKYPVGKEKPLNLNSHNLIIPQETTEERIQRMRESLVSGVSDKLKMAIRFQVENGEVIEKECSSDIIYKSYIKRFGTTTGGTYGVPTYEKFMEWYQGVQDEMMELTKLKDPE